MAFKATGLVTDGKLPTTIWQDCLKAVAELDGKRVVITIEEVKPRRSMNQNAYMWSVVIPPITKLFREMGNDMDDEDVHEYLKTEVGKLKRIVVTPDGEVVKLSGSTKRLTKSEMEDYLTKVRAWAASNGVPIPLPNEGILYD